MTGTADTSNETDDERFDRTLRNLLDMPPKPHAESKLGKPRRRNAGAERRGRGPDDDWRPTIEITWEGFGDEQKLISVKKLV